MIELLEKTLPLFNSLSVAVAVIALATTLKSTIAMLKARRNLAELFKKAQLESRAFRKSIKQNRSVDELSDAELEVAVLRTFDKLTEEDRKLLIGAINQPSPEGKRRFLRSLYESRTNSHVSCDNS